MKVKVLQVALSDVGYSFLSTAPGRRKELCQEVVMTRMAAAQRGFGWGSGGGSQGAWRTDLRYSASHSLARCFSWGPYGGLGVLVDRTLRWISPQEPCGSPPAVSSGAQWRRTRELQGWPLPSTHCWPPPSANPSDGAQAEEGTCRLPSSVKGAGTPTTPP